MSEGTLLSQYVEERRSGGLTGLSGLAINWERQHPAGGGWGVETPSCKPRSCRQDGGAPGSRPCCPIAPGSASNLLAVVGGWRRRLPSQGPAPKMAALPVVVHAARSPLGAPALCWRWLGGGDAVLQANVMPPRSRRSRESCMLPDRPWERQHCAGGGWGVESTMLALPGAIGQHGRLPGAPPSWGQDLGLEDGVSTPQPPLAGCWRSQGRSGSMDDYRERRHLGGRTLACRTASPPPNHRQHMLALPGAIGQHARLPGAPRSWRHNVGLQDGVSTPQPPPRRLASQGPAPKMAPLPGVVGAARSPLGAPASCWPWGWGWRRRLASQGPAPKMAPLPGVVRAA